ncbi:hypothetical protein G3N59_15970 [Paraburkholderia sp. Ac-20340]|uniref:hypothetical protein n=1 Tax=Paraburkholderia sp. Ac-20340 TaxID=2703888 RepID=UPI0019814597|nr:hypothetical protein [Paraburkholderia sp. Ac-20340]MBN3854880.1 hypothetical protein [Paraburkholderia sp. Ac-20340]
MRDALIHWRKEPFRKFEVRPEWIFGDAMTHPVEDLDHDLLGPLQYALLQIQERNIEPEDGGRGFYRMTSENIVQPSGFLDECVTPIAQLKRKVLRE